MDVRRYGASFSLLGLVGVWVLFSGLYVTLKSLSSTQAIAGCLPLAGEMLLDLLAAYLSFNLWSKIEGRDGKNIFKVFCASFLSASFADGIYNVLLNIYNFQYLNPLIISSFDIPFAIFLLCQMLGWLKILVANLNFDSGTNKLSYIPYVIVSVLIFFMFMFAIQWHIKYLSAIGVFQTIDTFLEVVGFSLATICLARAQSYFVRYAAIGYLVVVSSDLIIRYHVVSGVIPYLSSLEAIWILGLLLFCVALRRANKDDDHSLMIQLLPVNSLQSQIAAWLFVLWLTSVLLFSAAYYLFSVGAEDKFEHLSKNMLLMIVPFSVLAIVSSSLISAKISSPLSRIGDVIGRFLDGNENMQPVTESENHNYIHEFNSLENFVFETFKLAKDKQKIEKDFSAIAAQVVHDIRSPVAVLGMLVEGLPKDSGDRDMMRQSLSRINEIADNLLLAHRDIRQNSSSISLLENRSEIIYPLVVEVVKEKIIQYGHVGKEIYLSKDGPSNDVACVLNPVDFKRLMSNILNNAVEAISTAGQIFVNLVTKDGVLLIDVSDTGCGMPADIINNLGKGISYNKARGNGLGLTHAFKCIQAWGGSFEVDSKLGYGTTIKILLPTNQMA